MGYREEGHTMWQQIYFAFNGAFQCLSGCALIENKWFAVHSGISRELMSSSQTNLKQAVNSLMETPCDIKDDSMLWDFIYAEPKHQGDGWDDDPRGVWFGEDVVDSFMEKYGLELVIRSHRIIEAGYQMIFGDRVLSLYSSANCNGFDNDGVVMVVNQELKYDFKV